MGQKFAAYDKNGTITGFYDADINPAAQIPAQAIEITDEQWLDCISNTGLRAVNATSMAVITVTPPPVPLAAVQASACNQIDAAAGQARAKYVTVTSMQSAVYEMKYDEAARYQAATSPNATDYPHLNAEATQTNMPIAIVAANVISTRNAWVQVSAMIEGYRLGGKQAVTAATDAAGVQIALTTALDNLDAC